MLKDALLQDFNLYRRYIFGEEMLYPAWQDDAGKQLMNMEKDARLGRIPALLLSAPPQHGKSETAITFLTWLIAKNPTSCKVAYSSVSSSLCKKAMRKIRRIIYGKRFTEAFGSLEVSKRTDLQIFFGETGSILATTVGGQIVGETLDFILIDDPHKNRAESRSETVKSRVKDWFDNDIGTRLTNTGGIFSIQTRWSVDDLYSHIKDKYEGAIEINYPAIDDEGKALFPELKPLTFLEKRKRSMSPLAWASLYQGKPTVEGGEMLDVLAIRYYSSLPDKFRFRFIIADTASTAKNYSDYSVFGFFGVTQSLELYLLDYVRVKAEVPKLEQLSHDFFKRSLGAQWFSIENKSSGIGLIQQLKLKSIPVKEIQRGTGQGIVDRALDYGHHLTNGKVFFPEFIRNETDIMNELTAFPNAPHDDFVSVLLDGLEFLQSQQTWVSTFTSTNTDRHANRKETKPRGF